PTSFAVSSLRKPTLTWLGEVTCFFGWVGMVALASLMFKALVYGGGIDIWNVSKAQHLFHNIEIVARISMFFTKASILLLYHRLFIVDGSKKTGTWWAIWSVFWYNLLYALALVLTVTTQCVGKPTAIAERGECLNQYAVLICASVINVLSDLMILIIPVTVIWGLQMAKSKKIRLSFLFAFGSLGVIASLGRLGYQVHEAKRPNHTVIVMVLLMLNIVEQMVGIIVACMPVFPSLIRHISEKRSGSGTRIPTNKNLINSFFARRQGVKASPSLSDTGPYSVHGNYQELGELEGGRQMRPLDPSAKSAAT
ncbi:MAG: hypothetical protein Q9226_007069, partial [Calogaya cf. arnoldii]